MELRELFPDRAMPKPRAESINAKYREVWDKLDEKPYKPILRLLELERKANGFDQIKMNQANAPIPESFAFYHSINRENPIVRKELQGHKSEHHRITSARRLENRLKRR